MLENIFRQSTDCQSQIREQNQSFDINSGGLNKIIAVSYDQDKSHRLPVSRYSLKINVIGLGSTGAALGIGLAALGHKVIIVDHDRHKVIAVNQARVSSDDLKLKELLKHVRRLNNLVASCDLHMAILNTDLTITCLDESSIQKKTADPSNNIASVIEQISTTLRSKRNFHMIVICQKTTNVYTQNHIGTDIEQSTGKTLGKDFGLCFVPIILSEDQALSDFYTLPIVNITVSDARSECLAAKLFNGLNNKINFTKYIKM